MEALEVCGAAIGAGIESWRLIARNGAKTLFRLLLILLVVRPVITVYVHIEQRDQRELLQRQESTALTLKRLWVVT